MKKEYTKCNRLYYQHSKMIKNHVICILYMIYIICVSYHDVYDASCDIHVYYIYMSHDIYIYTCFVYIHVSRQIDRKKPPPGGDFYLLCSLINIETFLYPNAIGCIFNTPKRYRNMWNLYHQNNMETRDMHIIKTIQKHVICISSKRYKNTSHTYHTMYRIHHDTHMMYIIYTYIMNIICTCMIYMSRVYISVGTDWTTLPTWNDRLQPGPKLPS